MDTRLIQIYERSAEKTLPLKRGPKKKERYTEPEPEPDPQTEDEDTETNADDTEIESEKMIIKEDKEKKEKKESIKEMKIDKKKTIHDALSDLLPSTSREKSKSPSCEPSNKGWSVGNASSSQPVVSSTKLPSILADVDTNSSSSEDQPLSHKEIIGTKRKAEVLSKESGKIGVTIKTSPEQPPAPKITCCESAASIVVVPEKHLSAPLSPETPASHPESDTPAIEQQKELAIAIEPCIKNEVQNLNPKQQPVKDAFNNNNTLNKLSQVPVSPRAAPPRLWLPKARKTDQVFITDVTVNLETVTIRECKTERGFFRERDLKHEHIIN